jgi:periplasmic protein TonB
MKKINDLHACLLISIIAHTGVIAFQFNTSPQNKPFEVTFEIKEEILPEIYEVKEEKKIEPPEVIEQEAIVEPVPDESIIEDPKTHEENEELQKSLLRYQDSIKQKIQENKKYPRWALRAKHQGIVRIVFDVLPSGIVKDLNLVQSSGFKELDSEALEAVKRASPFLSFPDILNEDEIQVEVDIIFRVRDN